jgi:hypothetical protein
MDQREEYGTLALLVKVEEIDYSKDLAVAFLHLDIGWKAGNIISCAF